MASVADWVRVGVQAGSEPKDLCQDLRDLLSQYFDLYDTDASGRIDTEKVRRSLRPRAAQHERRKNDLVLRCSSHVLPSPFSDCSLA